MKDTLAEIEQHLAWAASKVGTLQNLLVTAGVPVIGVLRPANSKQPVFRRLLNAAPMPGNRLALAGPGMRS